MTAQRKSSGEPDEKLLPSKMPVPWRMYSLIAILGLGTIYMVSYGFHKGLTMAATHAPLVDAAMEIKLEATTARLLFEEVINEIPSADIDSVSRHLQQAEWYAQTMLEGGRNEEGIFLPLQDAHMRAEIGEIKDRLAALRKATQEKAASLKGRDKHSEPLHQYQASFDNVVELTDDVETHLQYVLASDLRRFRWTQWGLIATCFLLWGMIGMILHRFERRQSALLRTSNEANESILAEIAQRKLTEDVLRESEERFRSLVETTSDWIWETDQNDLFTYSSPKIKDILGYSPEEIVGKTPYDLMRPDECKRLDKIAENLERSPKPFATLVHTALHKDGRRLTIEASGVPIFDRDGNLTGYRGINRDITERKQAEEERSAHLHFLEAVEKVDATFRGNTDLEKVLENVMETVLSIFECDRVWLLFPCDPAATTFRVPIEHTRPEYPGALVRNEDIPLTEDEAEFCRQALESDAPVIIRDDSHRPVLPGASQEFDVRSQMFISVNPKVGKPWLFGMHQCSYSREWTAAEQQLFKEIGHRVADNLGILLLFRDLRNNEATMAEAQRIAHFGNWEWDVKTGEVQWSEEIYRMLNLDPKSFQPQIDRIQALSPPEDRDRDKELLERATKNRETGSYEQRFVQPDGSIRSIASTFQGHYDEQGELVRIVGVAQDITKRKRAELALHKSQEELITRERHEKELVEAELAKARKELVTATRLATLGQLTATVSHELRNPLGSIRTAVFSVAEKVRGQTPLIDRALTRAERNIIRCDQIIEELLDYTRSKKPELKPTRIDLWLGKVLDEQNMPQRIVLVRNFNADVEIDIDREQLRRCLINLLTNACQAMEETPAAQARLTVETLVENNRLLIHMRDTGHGVSSDKMEKIFEPLYTTKGFGIGLGLAVVEQLIKQLDGGVTIESETGRGTTASLWLPLTPQTDQSKRTES